MLPKNSTDRRIIRTKVAIRDALVYLIEKKGFDEILVSDLAERANINRGTFYLHYQDKYDLLDKTQKEIVDNIEGIIQQTNTLKSADILNFEKPLPVLKSIFEYLKQNSDLMHAIFNLEGGVRFQAQIRKAVEKNFQLEQYAGLKERNFLVPPQFIISYAVSAHFGVIQEWLDRGCLESPSEMAIILSKISWFGVVRSMGFSQK